MYSGPLEVRVGEAGCLLLRTGRGTIREDPPVAYTIGPGGRIPVRVSFQVARGEVGFVVGSYDRTSRLVIDPVLSYSTLLSGTAHDSSTSIALEAAATAYMRGWTDAYDFPVTCGRTAGSALGPI